MPDAAVVIEEAPPTLHRRPLFTLISANVISNLGNGITGLAIPWFVLETTGSAARTGLVGAATFIPQIIAMILGGALVDRLSRKWMSIVADCASGITVALIPTFYFTIGLPFWLLLVLVFLGAILDTPGRSARNAMTPNLSKMAGLSLERTNSVSASAGGAAELVGPALAGLLIAWLGPRLVLYLDAVSFAISAMLTLLWVPNILVERVIRTSYIADVREGFQYLRSQRLLITLMVAAAVANFFAAPLGSVLLPIWVFDNNRSASSLGFIFSAFGGGILLGSLAFASLAQRLYRRSLLVLYFVGAGIPLAFFGAASSIVIGIGLAFVAGLSIGGIGPLLGTATMECIPENLRGRVGGATGSVSMSAAPLGLLIAGPLTGWIGVNPVFFVCGSALAIVGLWFLTQPVIYEMNAIDVRNSESTQESNA
ncbi:macrolide resistance MFS transporter Mrx(A) [soil metagenome]